MECTLTRDFDAVVDSDALAVLDILLGALVKPE
jgi:hypothetical protein